MSYRNTPFSVAMSVYKNDNPEYLEKALDSICNQDCLPSEIYLVIDGPIGNELQKVITSYADRYDFFTINQLEKNKGLGNALKLAVEKCRYDLIARMDSDDISAPGRFRKQIDAYLENPVDVLGGWTLGFFGDLYQGNVSSFNSKLNYEEIKQQIKNVTPVSHVTVLLNRQAVLRAGNYMDLYYHEDYYLWVRMLEQGCTFRNIPEYLVYVRCGEDQARRHGGRKYFQAELFLRKYMLNAGITNKSVFIKNVFIRFIYQIVFFPSVRVWADKHIKRKMLSREEANKIIADNK